MAAKKNSIHVKFRAITRKGLKGRLKVGNPLVLCLQATEIRVASPFYDPFSCSKYKYSKCVEENRNAAAGSISIPINECPPRILHGYQRMCIAFIKAIRTVVKSGIPAMHTKSTHIHSYACKASCRCQSVLADFQAHS